jgi:hypothetical protein
VAERLWPARLNHFNLKLGVAIRIITGIDDAAYTNLRYLLAHLSIATRLRNEMYLVVVDVAVVVTLSLN